MSDPDIPPDAPAPDTIEGIMWRLALKQELEQGLGEAGMRYGDIDDLPLNSALHRAGADAIRRNGFTEVEIVENFGYSPDGIE